MSNVVCIFAHPDDEALGPSGTIAHLAKTNNVYILCATGGEGGSWENSSKEDIADIRRAEMQRSAKILGVKEIKFLNFIDGELNNNVYHKLAGEIKKHLDKLRPQTILTFETRGVSGHIDHIAVSLVTSYLFEKLSYIKKIMYYCITERERAMIDDYFIYFPTGYKDSEIDEVVEIDDVWDVKVAAMRSHVSQQSDVDWVISMLETIPHQEHFLTRVK